MLRGGAAAQRWLGLETAAAGWRWAAGATGCLKGKAGDLGQLVSARGSENRGGELGRALRAGEGNEEGDGADRWAMLVSRRCERWQVGRGAVRGAGRGVQGDARSGPGRVRVRQAERARVEAGAGWAETEEGGEWADLGC